MLRKYLVLLLGFNLLPSIANANVDADLQKNIESRMQSFTIPQNMEIKLWADQTLTQNPGFFSFDSQGRMLIAEIYRIHKGVDDIRRFSKELSVADISVKTVEDRLAMYHQFKDELPASQFGNTSDIVKLLSDTNSDGKADTSSVFANGFNDPLDGLGSGVIERNGKVYYANIPHLWQLEDTNNDGISDVRTSLQSGFGTRVSFLGHDLHGLIWGPDGRLYWSIGDRGYYFTNDNGEVIDGQNLGAIFRANLDGSNIEVFYSGLRNPQELVFDEYGNLFTADNDGDNGDTERINHIIEGGDSGWHAGHQSIMSFTKKLDLRSSKFTGESKIPVAWLVNDMSTPRNNKQPAYMLPGIAQMFTGPSGFTYNPSNYLGPKWKNSFFVALYGGSPAGSFISTFKTKENGASFLIPKITEFARGMNVSDIGFGPDGRFYIAEFNFGGWDSSNEGAIYALNSIETSPALKNSHAQYQHILNSDFTNKSYSELVALLSFDHQKIRQRAQFTLAERGEPALSHFVKIANNINNDKFARIHSIWGISQLILTKAVNKNVLKKLLPLLSDGEIQVRIQTARVLGDHSVAFAEKQLTNALFDKHNQVAMYAALALGKINASSAITTIINKIQENGHKDLWLRHSLAMALKGINKKHWFNKYKDHSSSEVRLTLVLALRLLADEDIAYFLSDTDKAIVNETIIAIDDKALSKVRKNMATMLSANMPSKSASDAYIHHRIINANYNEGTVESAERLLNYAAQANLPDRLAAEALAAIEGWQEVNPIDPITGLPTTANKNRAVITQLIYQHIAKILSVTQDKALIQAMRLAGQVKFVLDESLLSQIAKNTKVNVDIRKQALLLLNNDFKDKVLPIATLMLAEDSTKINAIALSMVVENDKPQAIDILIRYLNSNSASYQKIALAQLGERPISNNEIDTILLNQLDKLIHNDVDQTLTIELIAAATASNKPSIKAKLAQYETNLAKEDIQTQYASTLDGGNPQDGKAVFYGDGACLRCHRLHKEGSRLGPNLTSIANRRNAKYLLDALVDPSKDIAPGYGTLTLTMKNGDVLSGLFFKESSNDITIGKDKNNQITYAKSSISNIEWSMSGMPSMRHILNKKQIRDILAFLKTLNAKKRKPVEGYD